MSRDIRSFFSVSPRGDAKKPKPKVAAILSSGDEDDANAATSKSNKAAKKPKKSAILSDSEDETPVSKKSKQKTPSGKAKKSENLKAVSPHNLFGSKPAKRVNSTGVAKKLLKKEAEFHEDDDFEKTLSQLDTSQIETDYRNSELFDTKTNGKRKHLETSKEDADAKKIRRDVVPKDERKPSAAKSGREDANSESATTKKAATPDAKETNDEKGKLNFGVLKGTKKTSQVVIERHETKKKDKSANEPVPDVYEEQIEKKKQRAALYTNYLQRGGARNPGSKPIPEGASNCLAGLTFLLTGVLDSLERDEAEELIHKYGGRTVKSLSKKTDYLVVGDEAGVSKLEKAAVLGTKKISEDELLDLVRTRPAGKGSAVVQPRNASKARKRSRSPDQVARSPSPKKVCTPKNEKSPPAERNEEKPGTSKRDDSQSKDAASAPETSQTNDNHQVALVEKYRPTTMSKIIGQHGDKSNAKKLHTWLSNWHKNQHGSVKISRPSPYAKNDDGAFFKACLLSGPPGVGKTTTVQVVCAELGLDLLEFNASDTRSKTLLKQEISGILTNNTVTGYFSDRPASKLSTKHVLLMDEVDGMAGNEDRGGLQELISLIKNSEVPVVCICNDRQHPKMRTLSNYTFDLRFQKPRVEQIRGAMKSLCHKENINVTTEEIDRLIISTNQDVRQVINQLAMLATNATGNQEDAKTRQTKKDLRLGPWDVIRKVFSAEEHKSMSIHDKSDLFFHDYNIAGLFVQENYLSVTPNAPREETLDRVARSADSLAMADLVENAIRGNGAWSLLPTQACFASVIPGTLMSGRLNAQANFPAWLGRNSKRGKFDRLLQEITVHSRLATGASKESINIDYLSHLRDAVVRPLALRQNDGIEEALSVMNNYHLMREDLESLVEVSLWPGQRDPLQVIDSKVKAAFTRAYNKSSAPAPYLINAAPKKKSNQASQDEGFMEGDESGDNNSDEDKDDMDADRMIKAKKATAGNKTTSANKTEAKAAKRGRGRARAK